MQIERSVEQPVNAKPSINESTEPDSNAIIQREGHFSKQCSPILSTAEGMQTDDSDWQVANA
jgi:hypothetical protein